MEEDGVLMSRYWPWLISNYWVSRSLVQSGFGVHDRVMRQKATIMRVRIDGSSDDARLQFLGLGVRVLGLTAWRRD